MLKLCRTGSKGPLHLQPPSGGCVLKLQPPAQSRPGCCAAAFGRLCVETAKYQPRCHLRRWQPPSGGCVLKHLHDKERSGQSRQPPSGGCVLKRETQTRMGTERRQPPSGGCVLKPLGCSHSFLGCGQPPSGGCVLKLLSAGAVRRRPAQPPSGGCVLKQPARRLCALTRRSRLRAAVC